MSKEPTVFVISAAMEERLYDIAHRVPKPRGFRTTTAALRRRGLIKWVVDHYQPTEWGNAQLAAMAKRSIKNG